MTFEILISNAYLNDVVGDLSTPVTLRRLPLNRRRPLDNLFHGGCSRFAGLAVRLLGDEDARRLGRFADSRLVLCEDPVLILGTLDEIVVRLLGPADRVAVHLDKARAVARRTLDIVAFDLRAAVERRRFPYQRARTACHVLDSKVSRWSRRI